MNKLILLMNPISGTGDKAGLKAMISLKLEQWGVPFLFMDTDPTGAYIELREKIKAEGVRRIVLIGGDGTVSHSTSVLRELPVEFAVIPAGSGNGLARAANIPTDPLEALELAVYGKAIWIDAFTINQHFSCMLSGIGFDAQVAHDFAKMKTRGLWTYARISAANFFDAVEYPFTLHLNGKEVHTEAYFISIANGNQFGNNFTIAPKAQLNDGLLDIIIVQKMNKMQVLLSVFYQMKYGTVQHDIKDKEGILYFQASSIEIHNPMLAPLHVDGDPVETSKLIKVDLLPKALPLILANS
jgi:YegS/Rv2252/BmrU family lipid kinase